MQVFVKLDKSHHTLEIEPTDTILEVKQKVAAKIGGQWTADRIILTCGTKLLKDDLTVADYNIQQHSTLTVGLRPVPLSYDPAVKACLSVHLQNLIKDKQSQLVFIALGSYDHAHGDDTIRRQQCPSEIFNLCTFLKWGLTILLIDAAFATPRDPQAPQIYEIDPKWQLTEEKDKVREFKYSGSPEFRLFTYATQVLSGEYGGKQLTLADLDLENQVGPAIASAGGALVVGNFYDTSNLPYLFAGPQAQVLPVLKVFGHQVAEHYHYKG